MRGECEGCIVWRTAQGNLLVVRGPSVTAIPGGVIGTVVSRGSSVVAAAVLRWLVIAPAAERVDLVRDGRRLKDWLWRSRCQVFVAGDCTVTVLRRSLLVRLTQAG